MASAKAATNGSCGHGYHEPPPPATGHAAARTMRKKTPPSASKSKEVSLVRSSAAEYLTFIAATGGGSTSVEMRYENENLWLTQKMMATLYDVSVPAISQHLKRIYADNELEREATVKPYLMVQTEGEREVRRSVDHYSLQAIIAVGFKIENERAVQFRKWANQIVKDYTIQGWVMDPERLKSDGSVLTEDFFERQLEKIREIRMSERRFYQKVTDIYATALDYDASATATQRFFAVVQNKLHYAIHGQTAPERLPETLGPRYPARRRQGVGRDRQGTRRNRVREIPDRAGPAV
ncbi:RhuM family protein [Hydrogenophaga sp.]|uniref:RhuM family protein n=1 Tax=Hydrogenophaga sp. TaxID=1904254 RepID=UPI00286E42E8|nr:RhuM family protein [Hydrogenophaga sp.]